MRNALAGVLALSVVPGGFTVAQFASKVHAMTGQTEADYSLRQASYDLRKLRGKHLVAKIRRSRCYEVPELAARTIAGLTVLREQVIAPILAGVRVPYLGQRPATWTQVDQDYEVLKRGMKTLFRHLGVATGAAMAA
jgi:hypothetical protein